MAVFTVLFYHLDHSSISVTLYCTFTLESNFPILPLHTESNICFRLIVWFQIWPETKLIQDQDNYKKCYNYITSAMLLQGEISLIFIFFMRIQGN